MTIQYSAIARGTVILVSHQTGHRNYEQLIESMLPNIPSENTKASYSSEDFLVHVVIEDQIVYLCAVESSFDRRKSFGFLEEIRLRFSKSTLGVRAMTARNHEFDRDFEYILGEEMGKFSAMKDTDNISKLRSQVDEVKGVMTQNVEKVIQRGEKMEDLLSKTQDLEESAVIFRNTSKKVHRTMKWRNIRMWLILAIFIILIITLIILFSTGVISGDN